MLSLEEHKKSNQQNYKTDSTTHSKIGLNSTLYLAYRDVPEILKMHVFDRVPQDKCRTLDFGCGAGLSTELIANMITNAGHKVDIFGIDINEENLEFARKRVPQGSFKKIEPYQSLESLGQFDLIICNFVLLEHKSIDMLKILKSIQLLLKDSGMLLVTNCASSVYKKTNEWYSFTSDFPENAPSLINTKLKFKDDQPVKVKLFQDGGNSFTFFDFFHSGKAYREAYQKAGLILLQTHKPIGKDSDQIPWKSEKNHSPYKIHVLYKQSQFSETNIYKK